MQRAPSRQTVPVFNYTPFARSTQTAPIASLQALFTPALVQQSSDARIKALLERLPDYLHINRDQIGLDRSAHYPIMGLTHPAQGRGRDRIGLSVAEVERLGAFGHGGQRGAASMPFAKQMQKGAQQVLLHEIVHANQNMDASAALATRLAGQGGEGNTADARARDLQHAFIEGGAEYLSRKVARQQTGYRYPTLTHPYQPLIETLKQQYGRNLGRTLRSILEGSG